MYMTASNLFPYPRTVTRHRPFGKGLGHGMAWHGLLRHGMLWHAMATHSKAWNGTPWVLMACHGMRNCLIAIAHCLLIIGYCLLPIAYCLLPIAYWLLPIASRLLSIAYCLLPIAYCLYYELVISTRSWWVSVVHVRKKWCFVLAKVRSTVRTWEAVPYVCTAKQSAISEY